MQVNAVAALCCCTTNLPPSIIARKHSPLDRMFQCQMEAPALVDLGPRLESLAISLPLLLLLFASAYLVMAA